MTLAGLRPGEKLYEEKLMAEEGLKRTENDLIHIGCPIPFDTDEFLGELDDLMEAAYSYYFYLFYLADNNTRFEYYGFKRIVFSKYSGRWGIK